MSQNDTCITRLEQVMSSFSNCASEFIHVKLGGFCARELCLADPNSPMVIVYPAGHGDQTCVGIQAEFALDGF